MTDSIKVTVASYGDHRNLMLTYFDPITGKKVAKSAGTRDEGKAWKAAGVWQDELNSGRYAAPSKVTWAAFRERYEAEKLAGIGPCNARGCLCGPGSPRARHQPRSAREAHSGRSEPFPSEATG